MRWPRRHKSDIVLAAGLCLSSLIAGAAALALAEFGAPPLVFVGLFAWLLTVGLPTLTSVLLLVSVWPGPSLQAFVVSAIALSFLSQLGAVFGVRWGIARWRRSPQP